MNTGPQIHALASVATSQFWPCEINTPDSGESGYGDAMIKLTRLNGEEFVVNADLIRFIESRPDTFVTLTTDDRFIVRESLDEVVRRSVEFNRAARLLPAA